MPRNLAGFSVAVCSASMRREAGGYEALQLFVQAEAGKNVNAGRRIGSGEKRNAGAVHRVHDFEFFFDEALSGGEVVGVEVVNDLSVKRFQVTSFQ